jgi:MoaA/NifB/PqqE/SkfB family radical SAM enzyme
MEKDISMLQSTNVNKIKSLFNKVFKRVEKSTFCAYPNFHLQIQPDGIIKPCCRYDTDHAKELNKGLKETGTLDDVIQSKTWKNLRKQMEKNPPLDACQKCVIEENCGKNSLRISIKGAEKKFKADLSRTSLQFLEIGFSNICNLACRTCRSSLSTKWYEDDKYLNESGFHRGLPSKKVQSPHSSLLESSIYKDLKLLKLTGGEPFLHKELITALKELIKANNTDKTILNISTNVSFVPTDETMELLDQFKQVIINASIDGHGIHNDYIRSYSKWSTVEDTLHFWRDKVIQHPKWKIILAVTISVYSLEAFPNLFDWWQDYTKVLPESKHNIAYQILTHPTYLAPSIMSEEDVNFFRHGHNLKIINYFNSLNHNEKNINDFIQYNSLLDKKRVSDLSSVFPQTAKKIIQAENIVHKELGFDIVFISYQEEEADKNFADLQGHYPHAKRVSNIKGIREAHKEAAKIATTDFFFTVDGDNRFNESYKLNIPENLDNNTVYVWRCKNAVNGLVYGNGGLKLWSKKTFNEELTTFNDHAMNATKTYKVVNDLVTTTYFNTSAFASWRSGFREAVKLSDNIQNEKDTVSKSRLESWVNQGQDQEYGNECIEGAKKGADFFKEHGAQKSYDLINDFEELKKMFKVGMTK